MARLENSRGLERSEVRRVLREAEKWLWAARQERLRYVLEHFLDAPKTRG